MYRYLINLSYIGTPFRGLQRQLPLRELRKEDPTTVQGQVDIALKRLRSVNLPKTVTSSRTDSGVHALHTTMHVDMETPSGNPFEPIAITTNLNKYFHKHDLPIRILKTYLVPNEFHCRYNAVSRTYLYRLMVCHNDTGAVNDSMLFRHIPIQEFSRSLCISTSTFDIDKTREAARLFEGLHDFRTFMHKSTLRPDKITKRTIEKLEIREGHAFWDNEYSWPNCMKEDRNSYKAYDIVLTGSSFLYKQNYLAYFKNLLTMQLNSSR